jgi:parvulin-like peptidyl-prolyl isomerase
VAVVNGEPISEAEVNGALGRLHGAESQHKPGGVSVTQFVERAIDDRLMLQDAGRMGLFEQPDVRQAVRAYLTREAVGRLYNEEIASRVKVSEAEIKEKFLAGYDEAGLVVFSLEAPEKAEEAARRLREGASPAEVATALGVEEPPERFMRRALAGEEFLPLFGMKPGEVMGPLAKQGRHLVIKMVRLRPAEVKDFPLFRDSIERPIRKLREQEQGERYLAELKTKHPHQTDEALLASLPADLEGMAALKEDERVVARVDEAELRVGEVAAEVERALRRRPEGLAPAEATRNVVKAWVEERLVDTEALSRRYEEIDPVLARELESYREDLVLRIYLNRVVVPQVKIDDAGVAAYYEAHQQDYLQPGRLKLRQMSLASAEKAAWALEELKKGAEFGWLAKTHSVDQLAEKGGQIGWVAEDRLNPQALEALKGVEPGGVSAVVHLGENYQIMKLEEREAPQPFPLEEVGRQVRSDLYRAELEKARLQVAARLREGAEIEVNPEGLARLKERLFGADGKSN